MRSDGRRPVAIIGGGASGTILAAQLARHGVDSVLIEGRGRTAKGIAYSTTEAAHLLNVRAEGMSAWAGEPGHFAKRFEEEGGHPRGFAERRLFGRYLGEILQEAVASGHTRVVEADALAAERRDGGWRVQFEGGAPVDAEALVLATGNQEPDRLRAMEGAGDRFIRNPWGAAAQAAVRDVAATGGSVLLIGTGLTMVDLVLSLEAAGHKGKIVALSRRGQIPRAHAEFQPAPVEREEVPSGSVRGLLRWLRRRSAHVGWRAAIDSLRPHSQALWEDLDEEQQRRFIRHARPWWDVHRHRIAPQVADTVARLIAEGQLEIVAGRIVASQRGAEGLDVEFRRRAADHAESIRVAYSFNCTGPLHSIGHTKDPLLRSLLDAGAIRPDQLGIGVHVDQHSRAVGSDRLWALGPLTKGRYWEIIAVPDIREQAAAVAADIERSLADE